MKHKLILTWAILHCGLNIFDIKLKYIQHQTSQTEFKRLCIRRGLRPAGCADGAQ